VVVSGMKPLSTTLHPDYSRVVESGWPCGRGAESSGELLAATTEDSDFKIGRLVGFAKADLKSHPEEKEGVALC